MKTLGVALAFVLPVGALACPAAPDHSGALEALIAEIQVASDPATAQILSDKMWSYWTDAPDDTAQEMLDSGMSKRAAWDLLGAREDFDRLVAYCPDYAEGYNQRAFVNFLNQNFSGALPDLEKAIQLSPKHVGALSGRALTLIGLGQDAAAQDALAQALELNPWLPERDLVKSPANRHKSGQEL